MSEPTPEQMQYSAAMNFMEKQIGNVAREGAAIMAHLEAIAQQSKAKDERIAALEAELEELKKPETAVNPGQRPPP